MSNNDFEKICGNIAAISPFIRFVGVVSESGELLAHRRREHLEPLLDVKDTQYQFSHIAIKIQAEVQRVQENQRN